MVVGILALLSMGLEDRLAPISIAVPGTSSAEAGELLHQRFGDAVPVAILLTGPRAELDRQGPRLVAALRRTGEARVLSPWDPESATPALRPSPRSALVAVDFARPEEEALTKVVPLTERIVGETVSEPVEAHLSGLSVIARAIRDASLHATHRAEMIALPVLILVLLLVFRSPIAAALPLAMGAATVMSGRGLLALATEVMPINSLGVAISSMMGLALGVDYALLMVSRYRQEREAGAGHEAAVGVASNVAGRTIVFAGGTLAVAMTTAALLAPGGLLGSVAAGVVIAGVLSVLLAVSALPALLELVGPHLERWRLPSRSRREGGGLVGASQRLIARPAVAIPLVLLAVLALARPAIALQMGPPDVRQLPASDPARQSFEAVQRAVGPGWAAPFVVIASANEGVVSEPERLRAIVRWQRRLARSPEVAAVIGPAAFGGDQEMAKARKAYRDAPQQLDDVEGALADLRRGLRRARDGVADMRDGMRSGAAGARRLGDGAREAQEGAAEDGLGRATQGSRELARGLDRAVEGATRLAAGQRELSAGAERLAAGLATLDSSVRAAVEQVEVFGDQMRGWSELVSSLSEPAEQAARELEIAVEELEAMGVGRSDPRYAALASAMRAASAAMSGGTGANAGFIPALRRGQRQLVESMEAMAKMPEELAAELADGVGELSDGADEIAAGSRRLEDGTLRLRDGLRDLAAGSHELDRGLRELHAGAGTLEEGIGRLAEGNDELAHGLADGARESAPLQSGLEEPQRPLARYQTVLHGYQDRLREFDERSPGAISSGYLLLSVLDGTVPAVREQIGQTVNVDSGGQAARILVVSKTAPNTPNTERLSERLQAERVALARTSDTDVEVGQGSQSLIDYRDATLARLPALVAALAIVAALTLVLVLRALLLPLVAVALNLATIGAAFGALQIMFGLGVFEGPRYIDAVSAVGVMAIMFILAIDYEVFLLARMREAWMRSGDHEVAIAEGLRTTAGVIAGAAVIMSAVFLAFAASGLASLSQFGAGLTVAVLLDATVVRLVLLPAIMRAVGPRAWWLPAWLDRVLPNVEHGGAAPPAEPLRDGGAGSELAPPEAGPPPGKPAPLEPAPPPGRPAPPEDPAPPPPPADELGALAHAEHRQMLRLLDEIERAGSRGDAGRVTGHAGELLRVVTPHFRYEQRALFPQLVDALGPEQVERLYIEQDGVVEALRAIEAIAAGGRLDASAGEIAELVRGARSSIAICDGLGAIVAELPPDVASRVLHARARVLAGEPEAGTIGTR
jgi:RND superfamily putative drug exporter